MSERYLNKVTVTLRVYDGHPLDQNLRDVYSLAVGLGARVEPDQVTDELTAVLGGNPHTVTQTYRETSWGASGAGLDIVLSIPVTVASVMSIWMEVLQRLRKRGQVGTLSVTSTPAEAAGWVADSLHVAKDAVHISEFKSTGTGVEGKVSTPYGWFRFLADSKEQVTELKRINGGQDGTPLKLE